MILEHGFALFVHILSQRSVAEDGLNLLVDDFHNPLLFVRIGVELYDQVLFVDRNTAHTSAYSNAVRAAFSFANRLEVAGIQYASDHLQVQAC